MKAACHMRKKGIRLLTHKIHFRENMVRTTAPPPTEMKKALHGIVPAFVGSKLK